MARWNATTLRLGHARNLWPDRAPVLHLVGTAATVVPQSGAGLRGAEIGTRRVARADARATAKVFEPAGRGHALRTARPGAFGNALRHGPAGAGSTPVALRRREPGDRASARG